MSFRDATASDAGEMTAIWNAANPDLRLEPKVLRLVVFEDPTFSPGDVLVLQDKAIGWVKRWYRAGIGYIGGIAVAPPFQRQGLGARLLGELEARLATPRIEVSGGLLHLLPGPPSSISTRFFERNGYVVGDEYFDLGHDLRRREDVEVDQRVRPARSPDEVLEFTQRVFPGGWARHAAWHFGAGGTPADFMVLELDGRIEGFCQIFRPGAWPPGPSTYFGPSGGLGPIGISESIRGRGLGMLLLQQSLQELKRSSVHDCVIDWTTLLEFYGACGFTPIRTYRRVVKTRD